MYGYASKDKVELVTVRVRATVPKRFHMLSSHSASELASTPRTAWIGGRSSTVQVYTRESLSGKGKGPCIVDGYDSTTVVNPSWNWSVAPYGLRLSR